MPGPFDALVLKAALPGLAPDNPTGNIILIVIILVIIGVIFLGNFIYNKQRGRRGSGKRYNRFVIRKTAANMGLQSPHIKLMEKYIKQLRISHPVLLFSNRGKLDSFLKKCIYRVEKQENKSPGEKESLVRTIYEIKETIEIHSRKSIGLRSTHLIKPEQGLLVLTEAGDKFHCKVVNNLSSALICSYPITSRQSGIKLKRGMKVKVLFWRENDAGYSFVSRITGFDSQSRYSHFYIRHAARLNKEQQRKHQRRPLKQKCFIYPVEIQGEKGQGAGGLSM